MSASKANGTRARERDQPTCASTDGDDYISDEERRQEEFRQKLRRRSTMSPSHPQHLEQHQHSEQQQHHHHHPQNHQHHQNHQNRQQEYLEEQEQLHQLYLRSFAYPATYPPSTFPPPDLDERPTSPETGNLDFERMTADYCREGERVREYLANHSRRRNALMGQINRICTPSQDTTGQNRRPDGASLVRAVSQANLEQGLAEGLIVGHWDVDKVPELEPSSAPPPLWPGQNTTTQRWPPECATIQEAREQVETACTRAYWVGWAAVPERTVRDLESCPWERRGEVHTQPEGPGLPPVLVPEWFPRFEGLGLVRFPQAGEKERFVDFMGMMSFIQTMAVEAEGEATAAEILTQQPQIRTPTQYRRRQREPDRGWLFAIHEKYTEWQRSRTLQWQPQRRGTEDKDGSHREVYEYLMGRVEGCMRMVAEADREAWLERVRGEDEIS